MANESSVNYGIKEIRLAPAKADGTYPDFETAGVVIPMIVVDSYSQDKEDDQTTDVIWEDFDDVGLVLPGQKGKITIVYKTNDLGADTLKYLTGATVDQEGYINEGVGFSLPSQAMQVLTRAIDKYPAMKIQYAKLKCEVKEDGTLGKNGLPTLTLTITKLANMDADGKEIPGSRKIAIA